MKIICFHVLILLMISCGDNRDIEVETSDVPIQLLMAKDSGMDSAVVFFMKVTNKSDSLVRRFFINDFAQADYRFNFKLPAGDYLIIVIGNVDQNHIGSLEHFSSEDTFVEYTDGEQPPPLFYGSHYALIGEDATMGIDMKRATSQIDLTISDIPFSVSRMEVQLRKTGALLQLNGTYPAELNSPDITQTISDISLVDTSYSLSLSCFPSLKAIPSSVLVRGYDIGGFLVYSGESTPFIIPPGGIVSLEGRFETGTNQLRLQEIHNK